MEKSTENAAQETFTYEGKTYKVTPGKYQIIGMGVLTHLDILSDTDAQKYLVEADTTIIQEVAE